MFKIFKVKVEDELLLAAPIEDSNGVETYKQIRRILCEKYDLEKMSCDRMRALYFQLYGKP